MFKNDKIFVFLVVLFSVLILFTTIVSATTETFNITGFDGNEYSLPSLPEDLINEKYYVITTDKYGHHHIYCFNESLSIDYTSSSSFIYFNGDGDAKCTHYYYTDIWQKNEIDKGSQSKDSSVKVIYSSDNLLKYKDQLSSGEDFFYNPPKVEIQGTLALIMQETPLEGVLTEIVEILPIVLMTIVGLIGLRKALAMLLTVLRQS